MYNNPHTTYTSPQGRQFRVISVGKVPNTEKYGKWHWMVRIRFLDGGKDMYLYYNYGEKIYKKEIA